VGQFANIFCSRNHQNAGRKNASAPKAVQGQDSLHQGGKFASFHYQHSKLLYAVADVIKLFTGTRNDFS
jgi:hypothetical protein